MYYYIISYKYIALSACLSACMPVCLSVSLSLSPVYLLLKTATTGRTHDPRHPVTIRALEEVITPPAAPLFLRLPLSVSSFHSLTARARAIVFGPSSGINLPHLAPHAYLDKPGAPGLPLALAP